MVQFDFSTFDTKQKIDTFSTCPIKFFRFIINSVKNLWKKINLDVTRISQIFKCITDALDGGSMWFFYYMYQYETGRNSMKIPSGSFPWHVDV